MIVNVLVFKQYSKGFHAAGPAQEKARLLPHMPVVVYISRKYLVYLLTTKEEVYVFAHVHLSVCEQDYSKTRAWIWMKCCLSTDVGTWMNLLTFEPDPDYSPDAGTGLLSPISYALQHGIILCRENPTCAYWCSRSLQ